MVQSMKCPLYSIPLYNLFHFLRPRGDFSLALIDVNCISEGAYTHFYLDALTRFIFRLFITVAEDHVAADTPRVVHSRPALRFAFISVSATSLAHRYSSIDRYNYEYPSRSLRPLPGYPVPRRALEHIQQLDEFTREEET